MCFEFMLKRHIIRRAKLPTIQLIFVKTMTEDQVSWLAPAVEGVLSWQVVRLSYCALLPMERLRRCSKLRLFGFRVRQNRANAILVAVKYEHAVAILPLTFVVVLTTHN
jgi:hypothetical protein